MPGCSDPVKRNCCAASRLPSLMGAIANPASREHHKSTNCVRSRTRSLRASKKRDAHRSRPQQGGYVVQPRTADGPAHRERQGEREDAQRWEGAGDGPDVAVGQRSGALPVGGCAARAVRAAVADAATTDTSGPATTAVLITETAA